jgi:hypothetical protein
MEMRGSGAVLRTCLSFVMLWSKENSSIIRPLMHTRSQENNQLLVFTIMRSVIITRSHHSRSSFAAPLINQIASIKLCWTIGSFDNFIISGRAGTGGASLVSNGSFSSSCAGVGGIVDSWRRKASKFDGRLVGQPVEIELRT